MVQFRVTIKWRCLYKPYLNFLASNFGTDGHRGPLWLHEYFTLIRTQPSNSVGFLIPYIYYSRSLSDIGLDNLFRQSIHCLDVDAQIIWIIYSAEMAQWPNSVIKISSDFLQNFYCTKCPCFALNVKVSYIGSQHTK